MYKLKQELIKLSISWDKYCLEGSENSELNNFYSGYQRFFLANFSTVGNVGDSYEEYVHILKEALAQNYTRLDAWHANNMPSGGEVDRRMRSGRLQNF